MTEEATEMGMHGSDAVVHFLERKHAAYELIEHEDTFAAIDEARAAGSAAPWRCASQAPIRTGFWAPHPHRMSPASSAEMSVGFAAMAAVTAGKRGTRCQL